MLCKEHVRSGCTVFAMHFQQTAAACHASRGSAATFPTLEASVIETEDVARKSEAGIS